MTSRLHTAITASATALALSAAGPVHAQNATPDQAAALKAQITGWLAGTAPALAAGPGPVLVTPAGDHLDVSVPMRLSGPLRGEVQLNATARTHDGIWTVTGIRNKLPATFTFDMPVPKGEGKPGRARTTPVVYTVNAQDQDGRIDFDPSFATPSTWSSTMKNFTMLTEGAGVSRASTFAEMSSTSSLIPNGTDRADFKSEATGSGYTLVSKADPDLPAFTFSAAGIHAAATAMGVKRDQAGNLFMALYEIGNLHAQNKAGAQAAQAGVPPALLAKALAALQDFGSDMRLQETLDTITVDVIGKTFKLDKMNFAVGGKSDQGLLRSDLELGYAGLKVPDFGMDGLEGLVPTGITINPYITGVTTADLVRVVTALNEKKDPSPADMAALFSHGGVVTGLDQLSINIAGTSFTGQGKLTMTSPTAMTGTAQLVAENYDTMVQKVSTFPMAAQAMPVLIFLKGIGKADGDKLVWNITYQDGKALINNIDVRSMLGAAGGADTDEPAQPVPAQPTPAQPTPRRPNTRTPGQSGAAPGRPAPTVTGRVNPAPTGKAPMAGTKDDDDDTVVVVPSTPAQGNPKAAPRGVHSR